ncbi:hypothetical protein AB0R12_24060 [Streptomyces niveus]|uniref:hypothetical protein n=1 Tax=Streptomyces niveus TaxID=193462 RepID=UPI00341C6094
MAADEQRDRATRRRGAALEDAILGAAADELRTTGGLDVVPRGEVSVMPQA